MINFKEFLLQEASIKKSVSKKSDEVVYVFQSRDAPEKKNISLNLKFGPAQSKYNLKSGPSDEFKVCFIDFYVDYIITKDDSLDKVTINNLTMLLVRLFQQAFKDSDILNEFKTVDAVKFSGFGYWRHDTYKRFGKELARKLNAYDMKIQLSGDLIMIVIFMNKKAKENVSI